MTTGDRRVVVTGLGVVAPCGIGTDAFWDGLHRAPGPGPHRATDFVATDWLNDEKEARRTDRFAQFAVAVATQARAQAEADAPLEVPNDRRGVLIGTGIGGIATLEDQIVTFHERGPRRVSPFLIPMMMPNAGAAAVSMRFGWTGPCETTVTACAAGTHAIANAATLVATGRCDAVMAGGSEAALTPVAIQGFTNMTALSSSGVSRPFDVGRDGFVMAEGAGALVLESAESAAARGATILAELAGWASTADAHHLTAPSPGGEGAVRCMEAALAHAGVEPGDIGHVNAHGTSTPRNDAAEAEALVRVFGPDGPPVTSTKGVTGHALGAAGALEAVAAVLSIGRRRIPPTIGHEERDPELPTIDVVTGPGRDWEPAPVLSNSFGFGGHNGCLVFVPPR